MEVTKKISGETARGSEEPGEDLGIEILANVEGGSVDGLRPELLLVRPELGLLRGSACPKHRDSALGFRSTARKSKGNRGEGWIRTDWMVDWSGCGGARSALTPALMPKRRASWVSLISLFMPPLAIVAAAASLSFRCCSSFLSLRGRKGRPCALGSGLDI
jgi:hypothetical protein